MRVCGTTECIFSLFLHNFTIRVAGGRPGLVPWIEALSVHSALAMDDCSQSSTLVCWFDSWRLLERTLSMGDFRRLRKTVQTASILQSCHANAERRPPRCRIDVSNRFTLRSFEKPQFKHIPQPIPGIGHALCLFRHLLLSYSCFLRQL